MPALPIRKLLIGALLGAAAFAAVPLLSAKQPTRTFAADATSADLAEKQIAFWSNRVKVDPHDFIAARSLASARISLARATGDETQYSLAEATLLEFLPRSPKGTAETEGMLARTRMARHRFAEALEIATRLSAEHPEAAWLTGLRGDAALGLGRYDVAFESYKRYAEQAPGFAADVRLADMSELNGDYETARRVLRKARDNYSGRSPEPAAWVRLRIGISYLKTGELDNAAEQFRDSLSVLPDYYLAQEHLAEVYEKKEDYTSAEPLLRAAIKTRRDPLLLERLSHLERQRGHQQEADTLAAEALTSARERAYDGTGAHARDLLELYLGRDNVSDELVSLIDTDLGLRPGDIKSNLLAAKVFRLRGDRDRAARHLTVALGLGAVSPELAEEREKHGVA